MTVVETPQRIERVEVGREKTEDGYIHCIYASIRRASRKTDVWSSDGETLGRAGFWFGIDDEPLVYLGRTLGEGDRAARLLRTVDAAREFIARRDRSTHPDGDFDSSGRWYSAEDEERECCYDIRPPSAAWPYSLMIHCRTLRHIARLYDVDMKDLRRAAQRLDEGEEQASLIVELLKHERVETA